MSNAKALQLLGRSACYFLILCAVIAAFLMIFALCCLVDQDDTNTVDFIFISQLSKSDIDSGISDPQRLFSHHTCHCR